MMPEPRPKSTQTLPNAKKGGQLSTSFLSYNVPNLLTQISLIVKSGIFTKTCFWVKIQY